MLQLKESVLGPYCALLPPSSFHMTLFDLLTARNIQAYCSQQAVPNSTINNCNNNDSGNNNNVTNNASWNWHELNRYMHAKLAPVLMRLITPDSLLSVSSFPFPSSLLCSTLFSLLSSLVSQYIDLSLSFCFTVHLGHTFVSLSASSASHLVSYLSFWSQRVQQNRSVVFMRVSK